VLVRFRSPHFRFFRGLRGPSVFQGDADSAIFGSVSILVDI
jgi:hypothetical protein